MLGSLVPKFVASISGSMLLIMRLLCRCVITQNFVRLITLFISHRQTDLDVVYRVLAAEISDFKQDPLWGSRLIADPILHVVKRTSALGVYMQILLVTRAGEQWTTEREFQRRILKALHRRGVDLADGLEISPLGLLPSGAR